MGKITDDIKVKSLQVKKPLAKQYGDPSLSALADRIALLEATSTSILEHLDALSIVPK